jgi:hypothetical protein
VTDLLHSDLALEIHDRLLRIQGTAPSVETIDAEIQSKAEVFDLEHGYFPNLDRNGPELSEVDSMVMDTYGYDPDWNHE